MAQQEQNRALDKPISTPDTAAGGPPERAPRPAGQRPHGAMGDRRVSGQPPEAQLRPMRRSGGPVATHRSLDSRHASAGTPIHGGDVVAMGPGLPGGADRPPGSAEPAPDFITTNRRLRSLHSQNRHRWRTDIAKDFERAIGALSEYVLNRFNRSCGPAGKLVSYASATTKPEQAYTALQQMARQAESGGDRERAVSIGVILNEIDLHAALKLQSLSTQHGLALPSSAQAAPLPPAKTEPALDWCLAHRQLIDIQHHYYETGRPDVAVPIHSCVFRIDNRLRQRYADLGGKQEALRPPGRTDAPPRPHQQYRALEEMARQADRAGDSVQSRRIRRALKTIDDGMVRDLRSLTRRYPLLNALLENAGVRVPSVAPAGTAQATVAPPLQRLHPVPAPGSVFAGTRPRTAGAAALPSVAEHLPEPAGPSSRVMPNLAVSTPVPAALDRPLAHRQAIVERFRSDGAVFDAGVTLGSGAADALGWAATRVEKVLEGIDRLHRFAGKDPAALADIDWSGIEALVRMMDTPPVSPSTLPSSSARPSPAV